MAAQIIRGGQMGEVVVGDNKIPQFEMFCTRHRNPVKMVQVIVEEPDGLIIYSKLCQRCGQIVTEGQYYKAK